MGLLRSTSLRRFFLVFLNSLLIPGALADTRIEESAATDLAIQESEAIVRGRIQSKRSEYLERADGTRTIVTRYRLSIDETMKGEAPTSSELVIDGGTVGDLTLEVSDMPPLEVGEELVALGDHTPDGFRLHRRRDGLLRIETNSRNVRGRNLTVEDVRRRVESLITQ